MNETTAQESVVAKVGRGITTARNFVINAIFIVIVLFVLLAMIGSCQGINVPNGAALVLDPSGAIVEQRTFVNPLQQFVGGGAPVSETLITELTTAVERAADDERIDVIVLDLDEVLYISTVHARMLGDALTAFQASGGKVIAHGPYYSQNQFLLASLADELYLHPMGNVMLTGYGVFPSYFKGLLDKLKIDMHVFRVGQFKSAVEPFTEQGMSDAAKEANRAMVDALWADYLATVAARRDISVEDLTLFAAGFDQAVLRANGDMARTLLEAHLVDELLDHNQFNARLIDRVGDDGADGYNRIGFEDFLAATGGAQDVIPAGNVGLIVASGPIVAQDTDGRVIAADVVGEQIRLAREDEQIKAVVLRVDSPGGSAFASEVIRQELELTQQVGKPVVVSMGPVAASGGYWISATADAIYANPNTLTGSIGVFALLPNLNESMSAIGVNTDGVGTTPFTNALDPTLELGEPMKRVLQASVENTYEQFINLVAKGRDQAPDAVKTIAEGRVWTGAKAHELGLVDELGDLDAALAKAAELGGVEELDVRLFAPPPDPTELLLQELMGTKLMNALLPENQASLMNTMQRWLQEYARLFMHLDDPGHTYARCEACEGVIF